MADEWIVKSPDETGSGKASVETRDGYYICLVDESENQMEYAHMISAAPEMLEALRACVALIDDMSRYVGQMALPDYALFNEAPMKARAALAKASPD